MLRFGCAGHLRSELRLALGAPVRPGCAACGRRTLSVRNGEVGPTWDERGRGAPAPGLPPIVAAR